MVVGEGEVACGRYLYLPEGSDYLQAGGGASGKLVGWRIHFITLGEVERVAQSAGITSFFFFQAEDGIRDDLVTGVQTCALPISQPHAKNPALRAKVHAIGAARIGNDGVGLHRRLSGCQRDVNQETEK